MLVSDPVCLRPEVRTAPQPNGLMVLLDERTGHFHQLNRTGSELLAPLADSGRDRAISYLCDRYRLAPEQAAGDVDAFLTLLTSHDLTQPGVGHE